ncbi:hypothetical protein HDF26_001246 [Pedobacter cryoconitis]|uniref:sensor histidine kinase n=1 Tax=Pedobacter cryoconitis TaxID=188932 RepID=UPI001618D1C2|nr:histidine kinase [Pedobacter cryoconitis]MBB6270819.1 hypothetical protein [Pedobacter cryoconitis]
MAFVSVLLYVILFVLVFIASPKGAIQIFSGGIGIVPKLLEYVIESVVTYYILIYHVLLPLMRKERKFVQTIKYWSILFAAKTLINYFLFEFKDYSAASLSNENSMYWFFLSMLIYFIQNIFVSLFAALIIEWIRKGKTQIILEKQMVEAELKALKHQINPHFLFNSLSFIYSKVYKSDKETAESVLILANIMRYALGNNVGSDSKLSIMDEVAHLKNVIEFYQRRYNYSLNIKYEEQIDDQSITTIPLMLITLVENAFKHGDLKDPNMPLTIKLKTKKNYLSFFIQNKKGKGIKELSNGIGLHNIEQQLNLVYGKHAALLIKNEESIYNISLMITY